MRISTKELLRRFHQQFTGEDQVLIPINADPDAIASAMAVKRLLWRQTAGVTIANVNEIRRPDNLALIHRIGINLIPFKEVDPARHSRIVLVDSQPDHHEFLHDLKADVIIDHHPKVREHAAGHVDIRPQYGATASILTEYLRAAKIKPSAKLATALYLAIKTDTSNFERKTIVEDLGAFQYVFRYANVALAHRIEQAEMRLGFLRYFRQAIGCRRFTKGRMYVHLGPVNHPDVLVQIADFFMRVEEVDWSIVSGVHQRRLVVIFRNDGTRKNAGVVAKQAFSNWGFAGGHKSAARAEMHLAAIADLVDPQDAKKTAAWVMKQIRLQPVKKKKQGASP